VFVQVDRENAEPRHQVLLACHLRQNSVGVLRPLQHRDIDGASLASAQGFDRYRLACVLIDVHAKLTRVLHRFSVHRQDDVLDL
jgi:hypothetical protein